MRLESDFRRYHLLKKDKYKEKWAREDNIKKKQVCQLLQLLDQAQTCLCNGCK